MALRTFLELRALRSTGPVDRLTQIGGIAAVRGLWAATVARFCRNTQLSNPLSLSDVEESRRCED